MSAETLISLAAAVCFALTAAYVAAARRHRPTWKASVVLLLSSAELTLARALQDLSASSAAKLFWFNLCVVGFTVTPTAFFILAVRYAGEGRRLTRWVQMGLGVFPALTTLLIFTNRYHGWMWNPASLVEVSRSMIFPPLGMAGPWYWVFLAYAYGLMALGMIFLVRWLARSPDIYAWQVGAIVAGGGLAVAGTALDVFGMSPLAPFSTSALGLALGSIVGVLAIAPLRRQAVLAVTRSAILRTITDSIIVVDDDNRLAMLNAAAEKLAGQPAARAAGQPLEKLFPALAHSLAASGPEGGEATLVHAGAPRTFDVRVSMMRDRQGQVMGRIIVLRDITERKQAERQILRDEARLESLLKITHYAAADLQALADFATNEAIQLTGSQMGYIYFYRQDRQEFWMTSSVNDGRKLAYQAGQPGPWNEVMRQGRSIIANDYAGQSMAGRGHAADYPPLYTYLAVPIFREERIVAVVGVANRPGGYDRADERQLTLLMDSVWKIVERQQAEAELAAQREADRKFSGQLTTLTSINNELARAPTFDDLCRQAVEAGRRQLGYDRLGLWFAAEDHNTIYGTYGTDAAGQTTDERQVRLMLSSNSHVRPVLDGSRALLFYENIPLHDAGKQAGVGAQVIVGLWDGATVVGFLGVDNLMTGRPFTEHDDKLLLLYAAALGRLCTLRRAQDKLTELTAALEQRVNDRTAELRLANEDLAQVMRAKDEFMASMSHELRTPLSGILGMAETLEMHIYGPLTDRQLQAVHMVHDSGQHLLALINDLLDLAKVEAGKLELELGPAAVKAVCQASLRLVQGQASKKNIQPQLKVDPAATTVWADERRLKQMLVNLLSNAVKFTPENGEVGLEVTGEAARQELHFTVWDTGVGIAADNLARLFQPFVQVDSSLTRPSSGSGLGLSLVRRMAELHGGRVGVTSPGIPGQGSRFTVTLPWKAAPPDAADRPAAETKAAPGPQPEGAAEGQPGAGRLILVADDAEPIRATLSVFLPTLGCQVALARDGLEAWQIIRNQKPALALLDIQMPGLDGLEIIRRLRADAELAQMPVVAMTALVLPGDRERCLEAGASEYVSKPVNLKRLGTVLQRLLGGREG